MAVTTDSSKTGIGGPLWAGSGAYATISSIFPAANFSGYMALATDLGSLPGTYLVSDGTRWKILGGTATLKQLGAAAGGVTNTESLVLQTLIPAGAMRQYDSLRFWMSLTKSGTTDALNLTLRIGTAGTTADAAVISLAGAVSAASLTFGGVFDLKMLTTTSAQRAGTGAVTGISSYSGQTGTAQSVAVTIPDISANAVYASIGIVSAGTTNTVGMTSGHIQLLTP
jgi:hypothetical protein